MAESFQIEAVGAAHGAVLAHVHAQAFDAGWSAATLTETLAQPGVLALLALANGEPLGFVIVRAVPVAGGGEAEVLTIATRPQARRRGVARALMRAAMAKLAAQGIARVFLEVAVDNAPARAFYESRGFKSVGVRKGYYARAQGPAADALVLALDL